MTQVRIECGDCKGKGWKEGWDDLRWVRCPTCHGKRSVQAPASAPVVHNHDVCRLADDGCPHHD
jgi:DnaJ-class molecular chaperone